MLGIVNAATGVLLLIATYFLAAMCYHLWYTGNSERCDMWSFRASVAIFFLIAIDFIRDVAVPLWLS